MPLHHQKMHSSQLAEDALAALLWFEPRCSELQALRQLLGSGSAVRSRAEAGTDLPITQSGVAHYPLGAAATLLRKSVVLSPPALRPYFAVCALEAWRRVPVRRLAGWSGISLSVLKHRLAARSLTPAAVAAWNLTLHATWLLDVAELSGSAVVSCMHLGRPAGLAAVLGARGVRFSAGRVEPGAFAATLDRYLCVLRAAFRV